MRYLLLLTVVPCFAQAPYRGLSGGYGTSTMPSTPPFGGITGVRLEFRITPAGTTGRILNVGGILVNQGAGQISVTSFVNGSGTVTLNYGAVTDLLVRVQQDAQGLWIDGWPADGSRHIQGQSAGQALGTLDLRNDILWLRHTGAGGGGTTGQIHWVRLYGSTVGGPGNGQRTVNYPQNTPPAESPLYRYELEASGADSGPNGVVMAMTGASYSNTPVVAQVGPPITGHRAGAVLSVSCVGSNADTYRWRYLGTVPNVIVGSPDSATTQVSGLDAVGQYDLACEVGLGGSKAATTLSVGVQAATPAGVVVPASSAIDLLTGPILRSGASPWPFYDRERTVAGRETGQLIVAQMEADLNTPLPGLVTVALGSSQVTGQGTSFLSQYAPGAAIAFYYVPAGGGTARAVRTVAAVANDGSLTLTAGWDRPSQTAIGHQRFGTGDGSDAYARWAESLNYYDNVAALYVTYFKTGLNEFAVMADRMAQLWWWYLDGRVDWAPRNIMFEGLMIAAERGVLDKAAVHLHAQRFSFDDPAGLGYRNYITERNTTTSYQNFYYGARESGYSWRYAVALAQLHPSATVRNDWNSRLAANIQNHYRDFQCRASNPALPSRCRGPEGAFRWEDAAWNGLAEQPWHTGIVMQGLIRYHRLTNNTVARDIIVDWENHLRNSTQPGGPDSGKLWLDTLASDFPGVPCRRHYYWHLEGVTMTGNAGAGCSGGIDAVYGGRDINNEIISSYGYAYRLTLNEAIKSRGDDVFAATYGASDGFHSQWAWKQASNRPKVHGQGLCCNDSYLVDRLGPAASTAPIPRSLTFGVQMGAVPGATAVRVVLTAPNGATASTTCTSSPCQVTGDAIMGVARAVVEYLSPTSAVLARTESSTVRVD